MSSSITTSAFLSYPTTPAYADAMDWSVAYFSIHTMSQTSWRYTFIFWFAIAFAFLVFALLHWTGSRGGAIKASWTKWSIRRRTWRKKHKLAVAQKKNQPHRQPESLPSNAQLLCLSALLLATIFLSFVGPDYITPGDRMWQFHRREAIGVVTRAVTYDPSAFQPQYTISKAWWTSGGRTGLMAFALFPLCILFALKAPPFALFAVPFVIQLYFDKLAYLHRWSGRLIWLVSAVHVVLWNLQLVTETRESTGKTAFVYALLEIRFIYGWISFGFLTLLIAFSMPSLRRTRYEIFYFLHVLLIPLFIITAALHHPPVWWWCWGALGFWVGERLWRATWWFHTNGHFGAMSPQPSSIRNAVPIQGYGSREESWEMNFTPNFNPDSSPYQTTYKSPLNPAEAQRPPYPAQGRSATSLSLHAQSTASLSASLSPCPYIPPPGYTHAELAFGQTIRLRFVSPGFLSWAPGQHFLVSIPSVSRFTSHPFTVASACDERGSDAGRAIVLLVRAKNGWTKDLWDAIVKLTSNGQKYPANERPMGAELPARGVLMRMYVDGPFGSSIRAHWGTHSTVLIIAGGSGVSFALSILQYVCMCVAGRDGRYLGGRSGGWGKKGFVTSRIRFVWLVREFCHIQWCATILCRCMALVPSPGLQVDIFVTNVKPMLHRSPTSHGFPPSPPSQSRFLFDAGTDDLVPPAPRFTREDRRGRHSSNDSDSEAESVDYVDLNYRNGGLDGRVEDGEYHREDRELNDFELDGEGWHILDFTNFDGDNDIVLPGEDVFSRTVKQQGKIRREKTRRAAAKASSGKQHIRDRQFSAESRRTRDGHPSHVPRQSSEGPLPTDRLLADTSHTLPETGRRPSTSMDVDPSDSVDEIQSPPVTAPSSQYGHPEGHSSWDSRSDTESVHDIMPKSGASKEEMMLEIDDQEMQDVSVVSEHTWPGKPKLDQIVADEVENARGSTIVACCGPVSLNAMVRKIIASKIDPARIRRGDMRGMIALVSEEFDY